MKREWKPGNVAMRVGPFGSMVALRVGGCATGHAPSGNDDDWSRTPHWHYENGNWSPAETTTPHRPLVVIDPEHLMPGWGDLISSLLEASAEIVAQSTAPREVRETTLLLALARAFDAVLEPERAAEPTDPKARATDRRDNVWRLLADGEWICVDGPDRGEYAAWEYLVSSRGPVEVES